LVAGCGGDEGNSADDPFPLGVKELLPPASGERVAYGAVSDEELTQPLEYSHKMHAGDLEINCEYCHFNARRSIHAGVPPTATCMNCHAQIDTTDRPELVKLQDYWEKGEPIPWVKVHDLPDFVYFTHKRHVRAGIECKECHGEPDKDFTVARRVKPLTMGWCLNCHATNETVDENYGAQAELRRTELKDCWNCHK